MLFLFGTPHTCPICTDFRFKRSTQGWLRHVAILVGLVPFRCMHCQNRVWRIAPFTKIPTKRRKGTGTTQPVVVSEGIKLPSADEKVESEERQGNPAAPSDAEPRPAE
jgi:hypothetical protein